MKEAHSRGRFAWGLFFSKLNFRSSDGLEQPVEFKGGRTLLSGKGARTSKTNTLGGFRLEWVLHGHFSRGSPWSVDVHFRCLAVQRGAHGQVDNFTNVRAIVDVRACSAPKGDKKY